MFPIAASSPPRAGLSRPSVAGEIHVKQPPWMMRSLSRLHGGLWLTRAVTLGVRAVVLDDRGVFLVRHTYVPGWYLPGGGVDRGETAETAIRRELREEGGIVCTERPLLHGFHRNGRRDHVACYVVRAFEMDPEAKPSELEIAESGFFPVDGLPDATTAATRARLREVLGRGAPAEDWQ